MSSGDSGFKWILVRLSADVRTKYCSQALQEELADVQTQLSTCSAAMAHTAQVESAIASLEANQGGAAIRPQSVVLLLSELHALHHNFQHQIEALLLPFKDTLAASNGGRSAKKEQQLAMTTARATTAEPEAAVEEEDEHADQRKFLSKIQSIVTKQCRSTWLPDAVEVMREFVKSYPVEDPVDHEKLSKHEKKARKEWKKFVSRALEALRFALLEHAADNLDQLPRFLKALKKLAKRNADLTSYYKKSEQLLTAKKQEIADKKSQKKLEKNAKKKRKMSDASITSSVTSVREKRPTPAASTPAAAPEKPEKKLAIAEIRTSLARCAKEVKQLRDKFTNNLFDQNLNHLEDIMFSLSREFTYDDVSSLVTSLFAVVEHVEKVKQPVKRKNRLMRLEATLQLLGDSTTIPLSNHRRAMAYEYLTNCRKSLKQIQINPGTSEETSNSSSATNETEKAKKLAHSVADSMSRDAKRIKHESEAVASKYHSPCPKAAQLQAKKKQQQHTKTLLSKSAHVRFDN